MAVPDFVSSVPVVKFLTYKLVLPSCKVPLTIYIFEVFLVIEETSPKALILDPDEPPEIPNMFNEFALDCSGNKYPVANYSIGDLAFVAGLWRIQNKCQYKITRVRDKDMVLIKKLDRVENTLFEFWSAKMVNYNCYGPFVIDCERANYVVARYETDKETYLGYGTTIEAARAYLGLKLYDEYKDVINAIACKNKTKSK